MTRHYLLWVLALVLLGPERTPARSLSLEDTLRAEAVDRAFFSPDGRRVIYEYSGPWEDLKNPGIAGGPYGRLGASVLYETSIEGPVSRPLFSPKSGAGYWLDEISPSGQRVAISWLDGSVQRAGVYDFKTGAVKEFDFTPYVSFEQTHPVWVTDNELAYAIQTSGRISAAFFHPEAVAERLAEMWDRSWKGAVPAVTVLESHTAPPPAPTLRSDGRLALVNAVTGASVALASGTFTNLILSPDRRYLAALRIGGFPQSPELMWSDLLDQRRGQIQVFDLRRGGRVTIVCAQCDASPGTLQWSHDSRSLIAFVREPNQPWEAGRFLHYDAVTETWEKLQHYGLDLASEGDRWAAPRPESAAWIDGKLAVFARHRPAGQHEPYFTPTTGIHPMSGRADWYLVDPAQGEPVNLTSHFHSTSSLMLGQTAHSIMVLADGNAWELGSEGSRRNLTHSSSALEQLVLRKGAEDMRDFSVLYRDQLRSDPAVLYDRTNRRLFLLDSETGLVQTLHDVPPTASVMAVSTKAGGAAVTYDPSWSGTRIDLVRAQSPSRALREINGYLAQISPARRIPIRYSYSGEQLTGCALLPPDWNPGKSYAVIVEAYPNHVPNCTQGKISQWLDELLAAQGYIFFLPSTPQHLIRTDRGPGDQITAVILAGVDQMLADGYGDGSRLGLLGESQGGLYAPFVLTQTNRFKAAIAINGITDLASNYGELPIARGVFPEEWSILGSAGRYETEWSDEYLGGTPWDRPDAYVRNSPYFQSARIDTPLMLMQSDLDFMPISQFEELFVALYRQNKEASFVRYWGEEHVIRSPANARDRFERVEGWYRRFLSQGQVDSKP